MRYRTKSITTLIGGLLGLALAGCQGNVDLEHVNAVNGGSTVTERPDPVDPKIPDSMDDCADSEVFAGQSDMRLLTRYELDNTVRDLLGIDADLASANLPPENAPNGFENNSDSHDVNPLMLRSLMEVVETLSARAMAEQRERLFTCDITDASCGSEFVESFVTRAFRRPPTDEELAVFQGLFDDIAAEEGSETAAQYVIEAALQSPQFLYRIDYSDNEAPGALVPVGQYEMASRLSYFLWATMPDAELLRAAEAGELGTPEEIRAQAERMLDDPRTMDTIEHFYRQWFHLDALETMVKDGTVYPEWTPEMTASWKASIYAFIRSVHEREGTVRDLFESNEFFVDERMADVYGMAPTTGMTPVMADAEQRAGVLTHPALLAMLSYPNQGSPIARGVFVRERILCQKLPAPPDNIQIEPPDPDANATTRDVFAQHSADKNCSGCHKLIDPIGLGFENYDGIGRYRTTEHGLPVDGTGELANTVDPDIGGPFDGAVELSHMLAEAREVQDCVADHWFTFAVGRPETVADMCSADAIREDFAVSGGSFDDLMLAVVTSDAFRYRTVQVEPNGDEQ